MNFEQKGRKLVALAKNFGSNVFLYNRVEGVRFFYNMGFTSFLMNNSLLNIEGGYGTRDKRFKGELSYQKYLGKKRKFLLQGKIYDNIDYEESDNVIPTVMNTYTSLFAKLDHMDYYYTTGISLGLRYELNENLKFSLTAVSQKEQGAENNADFGLLNWNTPFRLNPDIQCGKFNGIRSSLTFNNYNTSININAEYTDRNTFKSDFEYGIVRSDLSYVYEPNYTSKFILTLSGGISSGDLPPQRWFDLGGKIFMQYYGNLRGVGYKAFTGDRMASGLLEYSFCYGDVWDSVQKRPWWEYAFRMTKFTLWTGQSWSELSDKNSDPAEGKAIPMMTTDGIYREFGFSIGDRFSLFRFDFTTNNSSNRSFIFSLNFWR
ncbi:MAG: hypothetical protein GY863_03665 [bacterium]|nr:hypothetical protein [bacterium]